jgi:hypothetical protein
LRTENDDRHESHSRRNEVPISKATKLFNSGGNKAALVKHRQALGPIPDYSLNEREKDSATRDQGLE